MSAPYDFMCFQDDSRRTRYSSATGSVEASLFNCLQISAEIKWSIRSDASLRVSGQAVPNDSYQKEICRVISGEEDDP